MERTKTGIKLEDGQKGSATFCPFQPPQILSWNDADSELLARLVQIKDGLDYLSLQLSINGPIKIKIDFTQERLVLGFGKAYEVMGEKLSELQHIGGNGKGHRVEGHRTEKKEALDEERIAHMIEHMNEDHADSVLAYAQHFGDRREASAAELLSLNNKEMQIRIETQSGAEDLSIPFSHTLKNGHDAHMTMIKMSKEAKNALEI